jgi:hypothetical protein
VLFLIGTLFGAFLGWHLRPLSGRLMVGLRAFYAAVYLQENLEPRASPAETGTPPAPKTELSQSESPKAPPPTEELESSASPKETSPIVPKTTPLESGSQKGTVNTKKLEKSTTVSSEASKNLTGPKANPLTPENATALDAKLRQILTDLKKPATTVVGATYANTTASNPTADFQKLCKEFPELVGHCDNEEVAKAIREEIANGKLPPHIRKAKEAEAAAKAKAEAETKKGETKHVERETKTLKTDELGFYTFVKQTTPGALCGECKKKGHTTEQHGKTEKQYYQLFDDVPGTSNQEAKGSSPENTGTGTTPKHTPRPPPKGGCGVRSDALDEHIKSRHKSLWSEVSGLLDNMNLCTDSEAKSEPTAEEVEQNKALLAAREKKLADLYASHARDCSWWPPKAKALAQPKSPEKSNQNRFKLLDNLDGNNSVEDWADALTPDPETAEDVLKLIKSWKDSTQCGLSDRKLKHYLGPQFTVTLKKISEYLKASSEALAQPHGTETVEAFESWRNRGVYRVSDFLNECYSAVDGAERHLNVLMASTIVEDDQGNLREAFAATTKPSVKLANDLREKLYGLFEEQWSGYMESITNLKSGLLTINGEHFRDVVEILPGLLQELHPLLQKRPRGTASEDPWLPRLEIRNFPEVPAPPMKTDS